MKLDESIGLDALDFGGVDNSFMAMPMCNACHQAPKIKAHYHYRQNMEVGLQYAGSSNLG